MVIAFISADGCCTKDLQELLSHVAPFAGYSSDKDYFAHENPVAWQDVLSLRRMGSIGF